MCERALWRTNREACHELNNRRAELIKRALLALDEKGLITYERGSGNEYGTTYLVFYTKGMDAVLKPLPSGVQGPWKGLSTLYKYGFELRSYDERAYIFFMLGKRNPPGSEWEIMQQIIEKQAEHPTVRRRRQFDRTVTVHHFDSQITDDDSEAEVQFKVREAVKKMLKWEDEMIRYLNRDK